MKARIITPKHTMKVTVIPPKQTIKVKVIPPKQKIDYSLTPIEDYSETAQEAIKKRAAEFDSIRSHVK